MRSNKVVNIQDTYFVSISDGNGAIIGFKLEATEPPRPQEGTGPIFDVPAGIALTETIYLPVLAR